ncbi:MAG TPA: GNAT family N-acetyltransferase [Clostridiaceae bacterium]
MIEENKIPSLIMFRDNLENLPEVKVPEGYKVRSFRAGEEKEWEKIIDVAFKQVSNFTKEIMSNEIFKTERVCFVCQGDTPVSTATAWYDLNWDISVGYLHMVGMLPEYSGKGLGLQASLAALYEMKREGKSSAVLNTDDFRIPAIITYLRLGFMPQFTHVSHIERWRKLLVEVGREDLLKLVPNQIK